MTDLIIQAPDLRQNPFPVYDAANHLLGWKWYDETFQESTKLYPSQLLALKDLLRYCEWLDHGPTLWQRFASWVGATLAR